MFDMLPHAFDAPPPPPTDTFTVDYDPPPQDGAVEDDEDMFLGAYGGSVGRFAAAPAPGPAQIAGSAAPPFAAPGPGSEDYFEAPFGVFDYEPTEAPGPAEFVGEPAVLQDEAPAPDDDYSSRASPLTGRAAAYEEGDPEGDYAYDAAAGDDSSDLDVADAPAPMSSDAFAPVEAPLEDSGSSFDFAEQQDYAEVPTSAPAASDGSFADPQADDYGIDAPLFEAVPPAAATAGRGVDASPRSRLAAGPSEAGGDYEDYAPPPFPGESPEEAPGPFAFDTFAAAPVAAGDVRDSTETGGNDQDEAVHVLSGGVFSGEEEGESAPEPEAAQRPPAPELFDDEDSTVNFDDYLEAPAPGPAFLEYDYLEAPAPGPALLGMATAPAPAEAPAPAP